MVPVYYAGINYYQVSMTARGSSRSDSVPPYAVRCVHTDLGPMAEGHLHVTAVETADPDGGLTHWSLVQVIEAVRAGERFALREGTSSDPVDLSPTVCPRCRVATLAVEPSGSWLRLPICPDDGLAPESRD
jgi:hypothetical protein